MTVIGSHDVLLRSSFNAMDTSSSIKFDAEPGSIKAQKGPLGYPVGGSDLLQRGSFGASSTQITGPSFINASRPGVTTILIFYSPLSRRLFIPSYGPKRDTAYKTNERLNPLSFEVGCHQITAGLECGE